MGGDAGGVKWVQETVPVDNLAVEKIFLDALEYE